MIDVYIGRVEDFCHGREYPSCVESELEKISNTRVADEKRAVYGLLRYAMVESFGNADGFKNIRKTESGKPVGEGCFFSLSHAGGVVVAAVSNTQSVGVDIEPICDKKRDIMVKKCLNEVEQREYFSLDESLQEKYFLKIWTQREAAYKLSDEKAPFLPKQAANAENVYKTVCPRSEKTRFVLTVACKNDTEIRFFSTNQIDVNC